jgi:aryl-alcohol dehydrogenase-like predicted oxidoreductase
MGGSYYGLDHKHTQGEADILAGFEEALENGITHFDTATGYGNGYSEQLLGRFMQADSTRRERIFLASKANLDDISTQAILSAIDDSRQRLQTDTIDLYYLHWPRTGQDMRPWMEGLEIAREKGAIGAVGVSNFSAQQMQQLAEVGTIDAYQLGYNLLWRFAEKDVIPYCLKNKIAIIGYSALAHGILSGKYEQQLNFVPSDQRWSITLFRKDVWPQVYRAVEGFRQLAQTSNIQLSHLAIRWLLHQPAVSLVLVSTKNREQLLANARALAAQIPDSVLDELTGLSDRVMPVIPDEGNPFGYHP